MPGLAERTFDWLSARLWRLWSPGYDATEEIAHLRRSVPGRAHAKAVVSYYRALLGPGIKPALAEPVQPLLVLLTPLPEQRDHCTDEQQAEQRCQVLPEACGVAQPWVFRLQPALVQLLQLLGRNGLQAALQDIGQDRPVAPRADPKQLRQANVTDHRQFAELAFPRQPAQACFIHDRETGLATEHQLQGLALVGHALQVEVDVVGPQVIGQGAGHAHRHPVVGAQVFQLDRHRSGAQPDDHLRHTHVGIAERPEAQAGRGLGQTGREIDLTGLQGVIKGGDYPQAWTVNAGKGRTFYTTLGHREDIWTTDPVFRAHVTGGIRWALGLEN